MAVEQCRSTAVEVLDLEEVAVGPYCVYDPPPLTPTSPSASTPPSPDQETTIEPSMMSDNYPYSQGMQPGWFTSPTADIPVQAQDGFNGNWEEWMRWDASSQMPASPRALHLQGPICYYNPSDPKAAMYSRQPQAQSTAESQSLSPSTVSPNGLPDTKVENMPYAFGDQTSAAPPFQFSAGATISPSTAQVAPDSAVTLDEDWDQQPTFPSTSNIAFPPFSFEQQHSIDDTEAAPRSTPSLHHSPSSGTNVRSSSTSSDASPEPQSAKVGKKRKSLSEEEPLEEHSPKGPPIKKTAHNMIEKRYRTNLNDKIAALRDSVPSLRVMSRGNSNGAEEDDPEDLEGLTPAHKLNKATVLSKATEYIRHLEKRNKRLEDEVKQLKTRLDNYDRFPMTTPIAVASAMAATPDGMRYHEDPFATATIHGLPVTTGPPQGMIPVPEAVANLHRTIAAQPHYIPAPNSFPAYPQAAGRAVMHGQQPMVHGRRGNGMMTKLMVGSLAGIMLIEGFSHRSEKKEDSEGRGLLAVPAQLVGRSLSHLSPRVPAIAGQQGGSLLPFLKVCLLFCAALYLIIPLFDQKPKFKKKSTQVRLPPNPSIASPIVLRRKAWLTAIQTVWVPKHNLFLETAALVLKFVKLFTRRIIGWPGYALLSGMTKEQEEARVKAWEIALDAQLTGGDAEISWNRLLLTLMASCTLPKTPARLMLRAFHARVMFWELANVGCGSWYMFDDVSLLWAKSYWDAARQEHQALVNTKSTPAAEQLPEHLAALLELDCDEVFPKTIVQRAYNLAWNRPSAEKTEIDDILDTVVEDFAIASPLDALAAWWSGTVLRKAKVHYLASDKPTAEDEVRKHLELAVRTAPPASRAQVRALTARAVIIDKDRDLHLAAALEALPKSHKPLSDGVDWLPLIGNFSIAADVRMALTMAKCLSLAEESRINGSDEARHRAVDVVNTLHFTEPSLTLLSFTATYKVLLAFARDEKLLAATRRGLELHASSMRIWIGREGGRRSGLNSKTRGKIVNKCVVVNKMLVGMAENDEDLGYASQSIDGDDIVHISAEMLASA